MRHYPGIYPQTAPASSAFQQRLPALRRKLQAIAALQ
jgi:hypothetical protein